MKSFFKIDTSNNKCFITLVRVTCIFPSNSLRTADDSLLALPRWGKFREVERLRLSDRNSILMTQILSGIRSEGLIGGRSSFIVLAIVYE